MTAEKDRHAQLDPTPAIATARRRRARQRAWAEERARREVLDLALAVDRGIGHDRDRLVQVVREVRARRRERGERPIPAKRADRLVRGLRRELRHLQVVGFEPERRELVLAPLRGILELVWRCRDLPARRRLPTRAGAADALELLFRTAALDPLADTRDGDATRRAVRDERAPQRILVEEAPPRVRAPQADALARPERVRIADVPLERDESALAREDVLVGRLDVPQRTQPERVHAEEAGVAHARQEGSRSLRERTERRARLDVEVLQIDRHALDLVDDRWEQQLHRLDRREAHAEDHAAQHGVDVLRVAAGAREGDAQRLRLFAQPSDGVDLAVVSERRERLHAIEAGARVRGVAVVAERHRGRELRVAEIGEVPRQLMAGAAQLVDRGVARQAHDRRRRESLDLDPGLVERARARTVARRRKKRELPEAWLLGAAARTEHAAVGGALALDEDLDPVTRQAATHGGLIGVAVGRRDEQVTDRESPAADEARVATRCAEDVRP